MQMMYLILIAVLLVSAYGLVMNLPAFGAEPKGKRLERIRRSELYKNKKFQNISHTPPIAEGYSTIKVTYDFLLGKKTRC